MVSFSHVISKVGVSLGSRRKESLFLRQKAAGRQNPRRAMLSSPGESSGSLFAWLVGFVVVVILV